LKITLSDKRDPDEILIRTLLRGGISSFVDFLSTKPRAYPLHTPRFILHVSGERCADIAMLYTTGYNEIILSFATMYIR
jgi:DNA gyrase/topoisomerase IV subunit B